MNKQEQQAVAQELWDVYCGILFHLQTWQAGGEITLTYRFDCPEYATLLARYPVEKAAGGGSAFARALRLCRWLHPRLKHMPDYDNHVPCNSLALLGYCFEREDAGINCLNKAKILAECCLALGIPARRVCAYPLSPYDMDNHVMTEIYDAALQKWALLDPTSGCYFAGEEGVPLSALEVRQKMASHAAVTSVLRGQSVRDAKALFLRNLVRGDNAYYAKNMAFFAVDRVNGFGESGEGAVLLAPEGVNVEARTLQNIRYRMEMARTSGYPELLPSLAKWLERAQTQGGMPRISRAAFCAPPQITP